MIKKSSGGSGHWAWELTEKTHERTSGVTVKVFISIEVWIIGVRFVKTLDICISLLTHFIPLRGQNVNEHGILSNDLQAKAFRTKHISVCN